MADKGGSGDKTEKPTPRKLAEARRKGDVAKSKDVTATAVLFIWLVVLVLGVSYAGVQIMALFEAGLGAAAGHSPFAQTAAALGWNAAWTLLRITALALVPVAAVGILAEFLQAGGVFTFDKVKPSLAKMNPVEGLKRMVSLDNLVELLKTLGKAALVVIVVWLVLRGSLGEIIDRTGPLLQPAAATDGGPAAAAVLAYSGSLVRTVLLWILAAFLAVSVLDMVWQRHSHTKKLRMSPRDIRQEHKESEGDPMIRSSRRQLHEEWANQNAVGAARTANVLVVNPTHIAIALDYDPDSCPVPVMTAKAEGPLAQAMRAAAEEAGVPIVRYVKVARELFEHGDVNELIPRDMFEAIAQIITWAQRARAGGERSTEMGA